MIKLKHAGKGKLSLETKDFGLSDAYADNTAGWTTLFGPTGFSNTGVPVTPITALNSSVVFSCVRILAGDVAKLPLRLMKRNAEGLWLEDRKHPLSRLIRRPNKRMTACDMVTSWITSYCLAGNIYTVVLRNADGTPNTLVPLIPSLVSITEDRFGNLRYYCNSRLIAPGPLEFLEEDIIHVRSMSFDEGIRGYGPVQLCAEVVGLSLATQQLAAEMFKNGAHQQGYIHTDNAVTKESLEQVSDAWNKKMVGLHNAYKTPVFGNGFQFETIQQNSEQIQMIEARRQTAIECARLYGIPLFMIGENDKSSYNSIDAQAQDYIDRTLIPITNPIEQVLNKILLFDNEFDDYEFRFDFAALEKGDLKTRTERFHSLLADGVLNVNEVRRQMNMQGIGPEGDVFTKPLNVGTFGSTEGLPLFQINAPKKEEETISDNQ